MFLAMLVPGAAHRRWIKMAVACQAFGRQQILGPIAQGAAQQIVDRHGKAHLGPPD